MAEESERDTIRKRPAAPDIAPMLTGKRATTQPCPRCGFAMPGLKGGSASICANCGFKDSCCY